VPVRRSDGSRASVTVTRTAFETDIAQPLDRTLPMLRQALDAAGVSPAAVRTTHVVGGSSRIPRVAAMLRAVLGGDVVRAEAPKAVVALGATLDWPRAQPAPEDPFRPNDSPFTLRGRRAS
jgi:molecular chaperone DnaK (HSP70)